MWSTVHVTHTWHSIQATVHVTHTWHSSLLPLVQLVHDEQLHQTAGLWHQLFVIPGLCDSIVIIINIDCVPFHKNPYCVSSIHNGGFLNLIVTWKINSQKEHFGPNWRRPSGQNVLFNNTFIVLILSWRNLRYE